MRTRSNTAKSESASATTRTSVQSVNASSASAVETTNMDNPMRIDTAALLERITDLEEIISQVLAWIKTKLPDSVNDDELRRIIHRFIIPNPIGLCKSESKPVEHRNSGEPGDPLPTTQATGSSNDIDEVEIKVEPYEDNFIMEMEMQDQGDMNELHTSTTADDDTGVSSDSQSATVRKYVKTRAIHLTKSQSEKRRCPICRKMFCHRGTMKVHIREVHRGIRKFACTLCPRTFKKASHLTSHKAAHEKQAAKLEIEMKGPMPIPKIRKKQIRKKTPCTCEHCGQTFSFKGGLTRHVLVHHTPDAKHHMCNYCGMTFLNLSRLKEHSNTHTDEGPYQCKFCPSRFRQRQSLRLHQNRHLASAKPNKGQHQCPTCGNILGDKKALEGHIKRVHEGIRKYACSICPLRFKTSSNLKQHLAAHAKGAKPRPLGKPGRKIRPGGFRLLAQVDPSACELNPPANAELEMITE